MEFNGTFLASIITFIVFVFLMNAVLYEPMRKIVQERKEFIDSNLKDADDNKNKADGIIKDKEYKISEARNNAKDSYVKKVEDYKNQKQSIINDAKNVSVSELEREYQNLTNISNEAKENIKGRMTDLANDIVEKTIGYRTEINDFDNDSVNRILYQ